MTGIDREGVLIGSERIDADNVIWAAGVAAEPLTKQLGCPLDKAGRVIVAPDLTVPGHPEIFILGDLAAITDARTGKPVPGIAPAAMQMGRFAARTIAARAANAPAPAAFEYHDKGVLATIGRARAVASIRGFNIVGLPAWLLWAGVHIVYLISARSRLTVMLQWIWEYLFFQRGARLITGGATAVSGSAPRESASHH